MNFGWSWSLVQESFDISAEENGALLSVSGLHSGYGKKDVLMGVSLRVEKGSVVSIIGPNGSGKSTVLKTVFGLVGVRKGEVFFDGNSCIGRKPPELINQGLVYVPQGNRIFPDLTVYQNITVSLRGVRKVIREKRLEKMVWLFPAVGVHMRKLAGKLSGGEKQQVALAIALIKQPRMLLLDEPSLGLAPNLMGDVFERLRQINVEMGVTILVVEHKVKEVFKIANWILGLRRGEIVEEDEPQYFDEGRLKNLFLG